MFLRESHLIVYSDLDYKPRRVRRKIKFKRRSEIRLVELENS